MKILNFLFAGMLFYMLFTWWLHSNKKVCCYESFFLKTQTKKILEDKKDPLSFVALLILGIIFSPDYLFASIYKPSSKKKDPTHKEKKAKSKYIILLNCINLVISIVIFMLFVFHEYYFDNYSLIFFNISIGFIGYRCISRSFELILAFYYDAIDSGTTSALNSKNRVSLATKSYIELILNYSIFYYLLNMINLIPTSKNYYQLFERAIIPLVPLNPTNPNIFHPLFKSIGISTFSGIGVPPLGIFSSLQIFTSFVLVIFAIAVYLSNIKKS